MHLLQKNYSVRFSGLFSVVGYEMLDALGRKISSVRDLVTYADPTARLICNWELILRGYLPMWNRGALVTSTALTDENIDGLIDTMKVVLNELY